MKHSKIIVLIGVSGAGKSHLINCTISNSAMPRIERLIAATTRTPRIGEIDGIDKYFKSQNTFNKELSDGLYYFSNVVYGQNYAYYKSDFETGQLYICELYYKYYSQFKEFLDENCVSIYIRPTNLYTHLESLKKRKNNIREYNYRKACISEEHIILEKMAQEQCFNYIFNNDFTPESENMFLNLINSIR